MSEEDQSAGLKFVVTNTLIVRDVKRSVAFYRDVLDATVLRDGEPTFLRLGGADQCSSNAVVLDVVSRPIRSR